MHLLIPSGFLMSELTTVASPFIHRRYLFRRREAAWECLESGRAGEGESPGADLGAFDHGTVEDLVASVVGEELEAAADVAQGR